MTPLPSPADSTGISVGDPRVNLRAITQEAHPWRHTAPTWRPIHQQADTAPPVSPSQRRPRSTTQIELNPPARVLSVLHSSVFIQATLLGLPFGMLPCVRSRVGDPMQLVRQPKQGVAWVSAVIIEWTGTSAE